MLGLLLAVAIAGPLTAQPAAPVAGVYQSQMMEIGSQLALSPNGRFLWVFSTGALDLAAEGRWTRASDGTILLNSDPVTPPRFELVSHSRDAAPGVAIRLACDTGQAAQYLDAIVEYADGSREPSHFDGLAFRTEGGSSRTPAAIYVGSGAFDLLSERVPITPGGDNVFTFRFHPNDIGRAEFRDVPVTIAGGGLAMRWRGSSLRYVRQAAAGFDANGDLPRLPASAAPEAEAAPAALAIELEEPFAALQARAGSALAADPEGGLLRARGPVDLRLSHAGRTIDLGRIEGGHQRLSVSDDGNHGSVGIVVFADEPAPLALDAALARARTLRQWLEQAGFGLLPGAEQMGDQPAFTIVPSDGGPPVHAADWADAAHMLADEARGFPEMDLFTLRTQSRMANVRLVNARRQEREMCPHSEWPAGGGEWRVLVTITPSLAPTPP